MSPDDAEFILRLVNEPSWLQFIGDRGVRNLDDARAYIRNGPMEMQARHGFGFYVLELKDDGPPIGICGLIKRDYLADVDIGYALLPEYWAKGYAYEAAAAVASYAAKELNLKRLVAITTEDNLRSVKLLGKLGLRYERMVAAPDGGRELMLFGGEIARGAAD